MAKIPHTTESLFDDDPWSDEQMAICLKSQASGVVMSVKTRKKMTFEELKKHTKEWEESDSTDSLEEYMKKDMFVVPPDV